MGLMNCSLTMDCGVVEEESTFTQKVSAQPGTISFWFLEFQVTFYNRQFWLVS